MRQFVTLAILAVAAGIIPSFATADAVKGGRQYMIEQREIMNAKRDLVNMQREVTFGLARVT